MTTNTFWLRALPISLMLPAIASADTTIVSRTFNPFTGGVARTVISVTDGLVRVERPDDEKKQHIITDLALGKRYLIDESDNATILGDLNPPSSYNDKATVTRIGDGPTLLNAFPTVHYVFQAGNVVCNHLYIADLTSKDIDAFMRSFTLVPARFTDALASRKNKVCRKAAHDAVVQSSALGVILLVKDKKDRRVLFAIDEITPNAKFSENFFIVKNRKNAKTMSERLRSSMAQPNTQR